MVGLVFGEQVRACTTHIATRRGPPRPYSGLGVTEKGEDDRHNEDGDVNASRNSMRDAPTQDIGAGTQCVATPRETRCRPSRLGRGKFRAALQKAG